MRVAAMAGLSEADRRYYVDVVDALLYARARITELEQVREAATDMRAERNARFVLGWAPRLSEHFDELWDRLYAALDAVSVPREEPA